MGIPIASIWTIEFELLVEVQPVVVFLFQAKDLNVARYSSLDCFSCFNLSVQKITDQDFEKLIIRGLALYLFRLLFTCVTASKELLSSHEIDMVPVLKRSGRSRLSSRECLYQINRKMFAFPYSIKTYELSTSFFPSTN